MPLSIRIKQAQIIFQDVECYRDVDQIGGHSPPYHGFAHRRRFSLNTNEFPEQLQSPKYFEFSMVTRIPAALIGRFAVSLKAQGYGIGRMLLADALKRTLAVRDEIAIYALVVDAIDKKAQGFYSQFGFLPVSDNSLRLFLPLKSI